MRSGNVTKNEKVYERVTGEVIRVVGGVSVIDNVECFCRALEKRCRDERPGVNDPVDQWWQKT